MHKKIQITTSIIALGGIIMLTNPAAQAACDMTGLNATPAVTSGDCVAVSAVPRWDHVVGQEFCDVTATCQVYGVATNLTSSDLVDRLPNLRLALTPPVAGRGTLTMQ